MLVINILNPSVRPWIVEACRETLDTASFPILRRITHVCRHLSFTGELAKWRLFVAWNGGWSEGVANSMKHSTWETKTTRVCWLLPARETSYALHVSGLNLWSEGNKQASGYPLRRYLSITQSDRIREPQDSTFALRVAQLFSIFSTSFYFFYLSVSLQCS